MKKAVVLLSGGMDSATTLYMARSRGYKCHAVIFDYGQRNVAEVKKALAIAMAIKIDAHVLKIKLPWGGSALLNRVTRLPHARHKGIPITYVPARNTLFLSYALSYAEAIRADAIFIGAHSEDYAGYPDCRSAYFKAFEKMKNVGTRDGHRIRLFTPLLNMKKAEIIKAGTKLNVPYGMTWSCYEGKSAPCRKCDSCYYRAKGFKEAGILDPLLTYKKKQVS